MKKIFIAALVVMAFSTLGTASAVKPGELGLGIQAGIALPMGTFGDAFDMGFGGMATFHYALDKNIILTGTTGYLTFSMKNSTSTTSGTFSAIPILPGIRYLLSDGSFAPYIGTDLGLFMGSTKVTVEIFGQKQEASESSSDFGVAPMVGFFMPLGDMQLDVNAKYNIIFTEDESTSFLGINAGIKFSL